jgi:PAS domain S-box-containing protein
MSGSSAPSHDPPAREALVIDSVPGLVAILAPSGEVDDVNTRIIEYCGLPLEAMKHWGTNGIVHAEDVPRIVPVFTQAITTGVPYDFEARIRRFDGIYRWFQVRGRPLSDVDGRIARWYVLLTDIDELKRAQEELRREHAFLATVQQLSATGGFYWWPATGKVFWSEQVYRIFELDPAAPLTAELRQSRIHPDDLSAHRETVQQAIGEARDFEYEVRLLMPDQSVKYVHSLAEATRDAEGNLLYVGAVQDVTQRRLSDLALSKVRSELARIARVTTLSTLTASIAHEVNQPLSGVVTNASTCLRMLGADPPNIEGARETARRTIRDGNRASEVITRLRALYSGMEAKLAPVDLNEAAREVLALFLSELQRHGVVVRTEFAENLAPVMGDRVQLQQVLLNLVRNASDAMSSVDDRPRELLVRTEPDACDAVRLSVRDAGVGFGPEAADKLFGAFYTTKADGMGMGLSVSRSIIERHRGRLWAAPNDGPGATFSFSVPCAPEAVSDAPSIGANRRPAVTEAPA